MRFQEPGSLERQRARAVLSWRQPGRRPHRRRRPTTQPRSTEGETTSRTMTRGHPGGFVRRRVRFGARLPSGLDAHTASGRTARAPDRAAELDAVRAGALASRVAGAGARWGWSQAPRPEFPHRVDRRSAAQLPNPTSGLGEGTAAVPDRPGRRYWSFPEEEYLAGRRRRECRRGRCRRRSLQEHAFARQARRLQPVDRTGVIPRDLPSSEPLRPARESLRLRRRALRPRAFFGPPP